MQTSNIISSFGSFPSMDMEIMPDIGFSVLTNDMILPAVCEPPPLYVLASVPTVDSWDCVSGDLRDSGLGMMDECYPSPCSDAGYSSLHGSPVRPCSADTPPVTSAPDVGFSPVTSSISESSFSPLACSVSESSFSPLACSVSESSCSPSTSSAADVSCTDHQLLRQRLRDTSLQQKLNRPTFNLQLLKSVSAEAPVDQKQQQQLLPRTPTSASWVIEQLGNVFDMALEQVHLENVNVCRSLGISPDPMQWSVDQVRAWLVFTCEQFGLPCVSTDSLILDGPGICSLTEEELRCWLPQETADVVYAQLLVWLSSNRSPGPAATDCVEEVKPNIHVAVPSAASLDPDSEDDEMASVLIDSAAVLRSDEGVNCPSSGTTPSGGGGGAHIHLWQFLKELLADSGEHGACIRWLDRGRGVFKIEDSVHVARLWGQRKKRPAMNYDKLSRSIRQYYKKGIMKKTERSQRLVYQFCHPYQL